MITIKRLGHVVLRVRNLECSVRFYRDILGLKEVARLKDQMAFFTIDDTNHHDLALMEVGPDATTPPRNSTGMYHVAFKIGDAIEQLKAAKDWLETNRVNVVGSADHTVSKALYLKDPDDNEIELYIDADPAVWKENPRAVASIKRLDI